MKSMKNSVERKLRELGLLPKAEEMCHLSDEGQKEIKEIRDELYEDTGIYVFEEKEENIEDKPFIFKYEHASTCFESSIDVTLTDYIESIMKISNLMMVKSHEDYEWQKKVIIAIKNEIELEFYDPFNIIWVSDKLHQLEKYLMDTAAYEMTNSKINSMKIEIESKWKEERETPSTYRMFWNLLDAMKKLLYNSKYEEAEIIVELLSRSAMKKEYEMRKFLDLYKKWVADEYPYDILYKRGHDLLKEVYDYEGNDDYNYLMGTARNFIEHSYLYKKSPSEASQLAWQEIEEAIGFDDMIYLKKFFDAVKTTLNDSAVNESVSSWLYIVDGLACCVALLAFKDREYTQEEKRLEEFKHLLEKFYYDQRTLRTGIGSTDTDLLCIKIAKRKWERDFKQYFSKKQEEDAWDLFEMLTCNIRKGNIDMYKKELIYLAKENIYNPQVEEGNTEDIYDMISTSITMIEHDKTSIALSILKKVKENLK